MKIVAGDAAELSGSISATAVRLCLPVPRVLTCRFQLPLLSAIAVPNSVVPSYTETCAAGLVLPDSSGA